VIKSGGKSQNRKMTVHPSARGWPITIEKANWSFHAVPPEVNNQRKVVNSPRARY